MELMNIFIIFISLFFLYLYLCSISIHLSISVSIHLYINKNKKDSKVIVEPLFLPFGPEAMPGTWTRRKPQPKNRKQLLKLQSLTNCLDQ